MTKKRLNNQHLYTLSTTKEQEVIIAHIKSNFSGTEFTVLNDATKLEEIAIIYVFHLVDRCIA